MRRAFGRVQRDDSGAALLIALGFITFFGLVVAAILSFADTGFRANEAVQTNRQDGYAAEGGIEAVIAGMRYDRSIGSIGGSCPSQNIDGLADRTVTVTCSPQPNSGTVTGGGGPTTAILTLGQNSPAEPGIYRSSSATLKVQGDVVSNSTIEGGANAKLDVSGSKVYARGDCTPADMILNASPAPLCNLGPASVLPVFNDPNYAPTLAAAPAVRTVPACTAASSFITLSPGTYNDATKLNALTGGGSCAKSLIWLEPGQYFFNFTNSGSHEWLVNDADVNVVGGAKAWTDPGRAVVAFPGGCDPSLDGVELFFGGDSRLFVQAAEGVEFCAPVTGDRIAIHGLKPTATTTVTPTAASAVSGFVAPGLPPTVAQLNTGLTTSASTTLSSFSALGAPAGAGVSAATLKVTHTDLGNFRDATVVVSKGATTCDTESVPQASTSATWTLDLYANGCVTSPADLTNLRVRYTVRLATGPARSLTATLTAVAVDVVWFTGGRTPQSGCVTAIGYTGGGGGGGPCALIKTDGNFGNLAIQGAVYAPLAALDINLPNVATQFYVRGMVARTVRLGVPASSLVSGPVISVPGTATTYNDREVDLIAVVSGAEQVRARVRFDDGDDGTTPGLTVTVSRWSSAR